MKILVKDNVKSSTSAFILSELNYYFEKIFALKVLETDSAAQANIVLALAASPLQRGVAAVNINSQTSLNAQSGISGQSGISAQSGQNNSARQVTRQVTAQANSVSNNANTENPAPMPEHDELSRRDNDWIQIELENGHASICANRDIALLIAVYRLLIEFGAVFARPGRSNEFLPKLSARDWQTKVIHIDETTSYKHRGVCIEGADSLENVLDFIDWLPKIQMNSFFIQFTNPYTFLKRWYEHELNPYLEKEAFNSEIAQEMSNRIDAEISRRGLFHHRVGHGFTAEVLGYNSQFGWDSSSALDKSKQSWLAELNGERKLNKNTPVLTSLCFSNPEVRRRMVEIVVNYAQSRPDVHYLHVWLSDALNNICECENCRKEIPADQYISILNEIDEGLSAAGLATKICFLIYNDLLFAPQHEKIINPDRFVMMFAPISRTFARSYADVDYSSGVPEAPEYVRNRVKLPYTIEENLAFLKAWQQNFSGDSFVYDYPLGRAHYGDLGYMQISNIIYRDIRQLDKMQLAGYISCQELRAGFPSNFPNYIMGAVLWNKELSYADVKKHYFQTLYGENWQVVLTYLENLSALSSSDYFNAIGPRLNLQLSEQYAQAGQLSRDFLPELEANIKSAQGLQKIEWRKLAYHRSFVIKLSKALELLSAGQKAESQKEWHEVLDFVRRTENIFQSDFDVYRFTEVAKNYAGFC